MSVLSWLRSLWLIGLSILSRPASAQSFKGQQLTFERVRAAYAEKWPMLRRDLARKSIDPERFRLFVRAFKEQQRLEVWLQPADNKPFVLFRTYEVVASSGGLGPKRTEGDRQVPEGFYHIDRFNPKSNYYLSLGLNYPNADDRKRGREPFGGDIFIHGSDVTIGCLPLTDDKIKEVYILAVQARQAGQARIPVHVFPFPLTTSRLVTEATNPNHTFWQTLGPGYAGFEARHQLTD
jgi:murein L,D-transpeptidase YafK